MEELRKRIDNIDELLSELFFERMSVIKQIADFKSKNNIAIENLSREKEIIKRLNKDKIYLKDLFPKFMTNLFEISKVYQELLIKEEEK
ncbi:MAG: chorismate mutase [Bacillota bacterium]